MSKLFPNEQARFRKRLGVIGASLHWIGPDGSARAYEPYVREMRIWADLFSTVHICGAAGEGMMQGNLAPYLRQNVEWRPVSYTPAFGFTGMVRRLLHLPELILKAGRTILECDFVLLRSPNHFGLVGALLVRIMNRMSITKWAGENGAYAGERFPSRVNRWLENIPGKIHYTLVYGPPKRSHQVSFIPALMTAEELSEARQISGGRRWSAPWKILSVGRLRPEKGFDLAIRGLSELKRLHPDLDWRYTLVGDGFAKEELRTLVEASGIADRVEFTGALPFNEVQRHYATSHIVIMPGVKEGWPKIIAEAWAHGAIPVAASAGLVAWILQEKDSGVVFEPTPSALAHALWQLLSAPHHMAQISPGLYRFGESMSLDQFKNRLEQVLVERFGLN